MCDVSGKAGGYFGCIGVNFKPTGNFYLLNYPNLMWVPTNSSHMTTVASPVSITGSIPFLYGRKVQDNVTYFGKIHLANGLIGEI